MSFKLLPTDVAYASYVFFDFKPTNFKVIQAVPMDKICEGKFCDGQSSSSSCGCIVARAKKHWALSLSITCDELSEFVTGEESVTITSTAVTSLLVQPSKSSHLLSSDAICPYDMEDAVIALCHNIAENQGFRLIGWFKPGTEDDHSVFSGSFAYHICAIEPLEALTLEQKAMQYGSITTTTTTATSASSSFSRLSSLHHQNVSPTQSLPANPSEANNENNRHYSSFVGNTKNQAKSATNPPDVAESDPRSDANNEIN